VDPWENPTRVTGGGRPDDWWLDPADPAGYVATADSPLVEAFASQGFTWLGGAGRPMEFRDAR
jgi:hypothetical protein